MVWGMRFSVRANFSDRTSLAYRLRRRRHMLFMSLLNTVTGPIRMLDVGGTPVFWKTMGLRPQADLELVLLNLHARDVGTSHVECVSGDATRLPFADNAFDIVFSNSVIEHVGSLDDQRRMAREVKRVGRRYFL